MITDLNEIQFPRLGLTFHIDPTAFTVFGLSIQWYGLFITLGLALAVLYCFPRMKRFGIDSDRAIDAVLGGVIGGLIGARLYYVIMKWSDFKKDSFKDTFIEVINIRTGGLAIYGGIIGALAIGLLMCKIRKIKILPMLDVAVIGFLIGQGIGRWGNFVNQEAFGTNTDSLFGMTGGRIQLAINSGMQMGNDMYNNGLSVLWEKPVHPCFLYESIWCILGFVLLAFWSKRRKYDGQLFLMYLAWYGFERFLVEGLRTDSLMVGSIRISQALSAVIFIVSVILQIVIGFRVKRDPERYVLYASTEESLMLIEESRRKSMGLNEMHSHMEDDIGILDDDDDDEIGILPDEDDDDDEIGELPDEDDDEDEAEDDEAEEVDDDADDDADNDTEEEVEEDSSDDAEVEVADGGDDDEADEEPAEDAPADTAGDDDASEDAEPDEDAEEAEQDDSVEDVTEEEDAPETEEAPEEEAPAEGTAEEPVSDDDDDDEYSALSHTKPDNSFKKSKKGKRRK